VKSLKALIIIAIILSHSNSMGQVFKPFPEGLGIEIGGGQNNLFWSAPPGILTIGAGPIDRTHFVLTPNIRINYDFQLSSDYSTILFVGYNRFGGYTALKNGYQDAYIFDVTEGGLFFLLGISKLHIGVGLKANYHNRVLFNHITPFYSENENRTEWFVKLSTDAGIRIMYSISHFNLSLEAWFGLNDLRNSQILLPGGIIREHHYRFLFGYTL
jgi:hypothetical protein